MQNSKLFTQRLCRQLLNQSGILFSDEELTDNTKTPASIGDILHSKSYWLRDENGKSKRNKTP